MKKEYDFSKGERGKFYKEDIKINYPVYLDPDNLKFIQSIAEKNKSDIGRIVNDLIKSNIRLAKVLKS
jgi:tartrate dehydratase alpha subunit/fumarate hydratase class I-like protein